MRKGIDADHLTYLEAGLVAQDAGVAAVALHARTAADYYSGTADWEAIARLKETVTDIPVLGNGDIWSAEDALAMVAQTGCDGVVVGRGCQGRPWLFADLAAAFAGSDVRIRPGLREVAGVIRRHAELMVDHFGEENKAMREMRKHMAWYLKGYVVGWRAAGPARAGLHARRARRPARRGSTSTSRTPARRPRGSVAGPGPRSVRPCRTAGSTRATSATTSGAPSRRPSSASPAAESASPVRRRDTAAAWSSRPPAGAAPGDREDATEAGPPAAGPPGARPRRPARPRGRRRVRRGRGPQVRRAGR